jgi:hypothetical protein
MCDEMRYNLDDAFIQLGGTLAMQFTLTSGYNRYGCWGLTDDINDVHRNYKFACVQDLLRDTTTAAVEEDPVLSTVLVLPNPASDLVSFTYTIEKPSDVELNIFDLIGREVFRADNPAQIGSNVISWDVRNVGPGVYYCRMRIGNAFMSRKVVVE